MSFITKAREAFNVYCAMGAGQVPAMPQRLQVLLHRVFVDRHYSEVSSVLETMNVLGVLASAVWSPLKDTERQREIVARGVVRTAIHLVNLCTVYRLDFFTLVEQGIDELLEQKGYLS